MSPLESSTYFVAQRVGRWRWPWVLLGWLGAVLGIAGFGLIFFGAVAFVSWVTQWRWADEAMDYLDESTIDSVTTEPILVATELLAIGGLFWCAAIGATLIHGLPLRSLVVPSRAFRWDIVRKVTAVSLLLTMVLGLVDLLVFPSDVRVSFSGVRIEQLAWLLPMFLLVLIQTSGEDVFFKGLLLHRIGAITGLAWLAPLIVTAVFIVVHIGNPDFDDLWLILPIFAVSELIILYLIVRTGGLEAALVLHWLNNVVIFVFFAEVGTQANDLTFFVWESPGAADGIEQHEVRNAIFFGVYQVSLFAAVIWKRSPFHLERHVPVAPIIESKPMPPPPLPGAVPTSHAKLRGGPPDSPARTP